MTQSGVHKIQRLFRKAAELHIDKADIPRYQDFVNRKLYDMLLIAEARARANGHLVIEPHDLPITKGLQESVHAFRRIDAELEVTPIIDQIAGRPPLDIAISYATDEHLPEIAGGLSHALAKTFLVLEPDLKNPQTRHWDQAFRVFDLLL